MKTRADQTIKAIIAENENPGTSTALPWRIRGLIPALKPHYVPGVHGP